MERHETETEIRRDEAQASLVAKTMVSVVAAMALIVMLTVAAFHTGGTIAL